MSDQVQPDLEPRDMPIALERLSVADDSLRTIAALRIALDALDALAWYADDEQRGEKARNAILQIEKQFDHEVTPSLVAETDSDGS